jgi:CheY-like chemotaxis protein
MNLLALTLLLAPGFTQDPVKPDVPPQQDVKAESRKDALQKVIQKAQEDYRTYFKEPKSALDFWAAAAFEIQVGKFDVAAYHLDKILQLPEKEMDEDLVKIEEAEGMSAFLRLKLIKQWSTDADLEAAARKTVDLLIDRTVAAVDKQLGNRERIERLVASLHDRIPEVRGYALAQLNRAKHRAGPVLAEALRTGNPQEQRVLKQALAKLDPEIMPPLLELYRARDAKEASDLDFLLNLLWIAEARADTRVVPYLWHMSSAQDYPKVIRDRARDTLALLLDTRPDLLPSAKVALTQLAEKYYRYKVRLPDSVEVADRDNPDKKLVMPAYKKWFVGEDGRLKDTPEVLNPDDARLEFGLLFARQALELDKSYLPAQAVYLALLLEAEFGRKPHEGQLEKLLTEPAATAVQQLLGKIDLDLLATALERAIADKDYAVALPLIDAIGERGEVRLAQPSGSGSAGLLPRLLYDPDRRVQYAAARALLKLPTTPSPVASTRVVEVLRRFLLTDTRPRVLIVYARNERAAQLRNAAKEAGYESDVVPNAKEALELLHASAAYDAIILNNGMPDGELPFALTQLRADQDAGELPLLLIASSAKQTEMMAVAERKRNCFVLPEAWAINGSELKREIEDAVKLAAQPEPLRKAPEQQQTWLQYAVRRAKGQAVSEQEKKRFAREALDWFAQMARGELPGYDLLPAKYALLQALNNEEMAVQALRIIARYRTVEAQQRLAGILLDGKRANLHVLAAQELNRHIQRNGLVLNADQIKQVQQLEQHGDLAAPLRVELATLIGTLRTTPQITGSRLLSFRPDAAPPQKDEK